MVQTRSMAAAAAQHVALPAPIEPPKTHEVQGTGLTQWRQVKDEGEAVSLAWKEPAVGAQGGFAATTLSEAFGEDETKNIVSIKAYTKDGKAIFGPKAKGTHPEVEIEGWIPPGQKKEVARIPRRLVVEHTDGTTRVIDGYIYTNIEFPPKDKNIFDQQMKLVLSYERQQDRALTKGQAAPGLNEEVLSLALKNPIFKFSTEQVTGDKITELAKDQEVTLLDLTGKPVDAKASTAIAIRVLSDKILLGKMGGPKKFEKLKFTIKSPVAKPDKEEAVSEKRTVDVAETGAQKDVDVSLVSQYREPLSSVYTEGSSQQAAQRLDKHFTMCKIKGDGHCLFRAVAVALLDKYAQAPQKLTALVRGAKAHMAKNKRSLTASEYQQITKSITLLCQGKTIQEIMGDETRSNAWVKFLRNLAAAETLSRSKQDLADAVPQMIRELNDKEITDTYHRLATGKKKEKELEKLRNEIIAKYIAMKTNMSEKIADRTFGTELELVSLSRSLKLSIVSLDLGLCAANKQFSYNTYPEWKFTSSDNPPPVGDIFLAFSDVHYNTLFSKVEPVEED